MNNDGLVIGVFYDNYSPPNPKMFPPSPLQINASQNQSRLPVPVGSKQTADFMFPVGSIPGLSLY